MSRLSVAGTDEAENTVKVESEYTKNHNECMCIPASAIFYV
jgi:hypothetical protein